MAHLERRRNLWYATLNVPPDLRDHFGKFKLIQSLGTPDKRIAEVLSASLVAKWKGEFLRIRGITNPLQLEAIEWSKELKDKGADPDQLFITEDLLIERAKDIERTKGKEASDSFWGVATGTSTPSNTLFETWKGKLTLAPKTIDQMVKDVELFTIKFPTLEAVTKSSVKKWMEQLEDNDKGISSQKRILSFVRNYWKYLQSHDIVAPENDPFSGVLTIKKSKKSSATSSWKPFKDEEVVSLWKMASEKQDHKLRDLILLGAYTGARIEELCSLKKSEVTKDYFEIADAKTEAGIRIVPIHSELIATVKRLKEESEDDYLIGGLTFNKYDDRSNAIGKRFGRMKKAMGYGDQFVFHSIRKTFTTQLENAGINENLAADIVGHEKPRITFGLYSGGASLKTMKEAIEKVKYPFISKAK